MPEIAGSDTNMLTGFTAVIKAEDIIPPQCQACGAMWFKVAAETE